MDLAAQSMAMLNKAAAAAAKATAATAATDITGFGLAGHASEMARSSKVTLVIDLGKLPLLDGAQELAKQGNKTRASATNREFVKSWVNIASDVDPVLLEFVFDAQTSGGLLISIKADRADELVQRAQEGGAVAASIIGHVDESQDKSVYLKA